MNHEPSERSEKPAVELWSFGFKYGTIDANLVVDARFLPILTMCHRSVT